MNNKSTIFIVIACLCVILLLCLAVSSSPDNHTNGEQPQNKYTYNPNQLIHPEYFANSSNPTPVNESDMINYVISDKTFNKFSNDDIRGIVFIPISFLNSMECLDVYKNVFAETGINQNDKLVLIRMPKDMYNRFISEADGDILSLPINSFTADYDNLESLYSWFGAR